MKFLGVKPLNLYQFPIICQTLGDMHEETNYKFKIISLFGHLKILEVTSWARGYVIFYKWKYFNV